MASLTPLAVSALALVNERPMHPYEMYQLLLERHEDYIVKVRPGSLYHTVERLNGQELVTVTGTEREGNRPERTTYAITDAGREALVAQLHEWLSAPVNEYPRLPLALSEAHNGPPDLIVKDLTAYIAALDDLIGQADEYIETATERGVPEVFWIAADYIRTMQQAEREWLATFIDRIETKDLPWLPRH